MSKLRYWGGEGGGGYNQEMLSPDAHFLNS